MKKHSTYRRISSTSTTASSADVMPKGISSAMNSNSRHLRDRIYNGAWSGRGASFNYQSGGHLNAAGVHCLTFLMLAKTCGVNVDEKTLQNSLYQFFDFSGKGSVPYGDFVPKPGFADYNGKTGGLAMAMAAAARLTPDG